MSAQGLKNHFNPAFSGAATYAFDFEIEVADIRADFPEETKNITFLDLAVPDAKEKLIDWYMNHMQHIFHSGESSATKIKSIKKFVEHGLKDPAFVQQNMTSQNHKTHYLVAVNCGTPIGFTESPQKSLFFVLNHELGHILDTAPEKLDIRALIKKNKDEFALRETKRAGEITADIFALARGLQKGILNAADAFDISRYRSMQAFLWADSDHFTSKAIERFLEQTCATNFSTVPPRELIVAAKSFSKTRRYSSKSHKSISDITSDFWYKACPPHLLEKVLAKDPESTSLSEYPAIFQLVPELGKALAENCKDICDSHSANSMPHAIAKRVYASLDTKSLIQCSPPT